MQRDPQPSIEKLRETVEEIDCSSQEGFSRIAAIARLARKALQAAEISRAELNDLATAMRAIAWFADDAENTINVAAEIVGCNYKREPDDRLSISVQPRFGGLFFACHSRTLCRMNKEEFLKWFAGLPEGQWQQIEPHVLDRSAREFLAFDNPVQNLVDLIKESTTDRELLRNGTDSLAVQLTRAAKAASQSSTAGPVFGARRGGQATNFPAVVDRSDHPARTHQQALCHDARCHARQFFSERVAGADSTIATCRSP